MDKRTQVKYFVDCTLGHNGAPAAERAAAVCEYVAGLDCSDERKLDLLKAYRKAVLPLIERERAVAEVSGPIGQQALKCLEDLAKRERGGRPAKLEVRENPNLIGGVRLTVADTIIERGTLGDLREIVR